MTVRIGSLFSGIGGFELGLERAIPGAVTVWQCEQNDFCQSILKKHWPGVTIYDDVRNINETVQPIDLLCGGFPCQSISKAGKMKGLSDEKKSGLWWEMFRVISILRPQIVCLENVSNILSLGGCEVIGSLAQIGYSTEWTIISASDFGAPHKRSRWFCVCWLTHPHSPTETVKKKKNVGYKKGTGWDTPGKKTGKKWEEGGRRSTFHNFGHDFLSTNLRNKSMDTPRIKHWDRFPTESPICGRNDGVPHRVDRIATLGNAIVPQCSEWVGRQIVKSGLLNDLIGGEV